MNPVRKQAVCFIFPTKGWAFFSMEINNNKAGAKSTKGSALIFIKDATAPMKPSTRYDLLLGLSHVSIKISVNRFIKTNKNSSTLNSCTVSIINVGEDANISNEYLVTKLDKFSFLYSRYKRKRLATVATPKNMNINLYELNLATSPKNSSLKYGQSAPCRTAE